MEFIAEFPLKEQRKRRRPKTHNSHCAKEDTDEITNEMTNNMAIWTFHHLFYELTNESGEDLKNHCPPFLTLFIYTAMQ
ncbi:hypothetical protein TRFO_04244 [Tritrichomonas foetus]|uniref:Uncharacterized protein n=1 Tax=Tritrichomonas foetus TaxID=1144522 RepID=A0A1J4KFP9_9EUKA|nr:hypothetical protein TRFO_04244 [Tritrichomonas foetus]|eukprot:OHT10241.1 hypothetical protein TRFO_04244 [Tritrichomonas foetus]